MKNQKNDAAILSPLSVVLKNKVKMYNSINSAQFDYMTRNHNSFSFNDNKLLTQNNNDLKNLFSTNSASVLLNYNNTLHSSSNFNLPNINFYSQNKTGFQKLSESKIPPKVIFLYNNKTVDEEFFGEKVKNFQRKKRAAYSLDHHVEVLVVADYKMFDYHQKDLENYILTLFSTVCILK